MVILDIRKKFPDLGLDHYFNGGATSPGRNSFDGQTTVQSVPDIIRSRQINRSMQI